MILTWFAPIVENFIFISTINVLVIVNLANKILY